MGAVKLPEPQITQHNPIRFKTKLVGTVLGTFKVPTHLTLVAPGVVRRLAEGLSMMEVASQTEVPYDEVRRIVRYGRASGVLPKTKRPRPRNRTTKSLSRGMLENAEAMEKKAEAIEKSQKSGELSRLVKRATRVRNNIRAGAETLEKLEARIAEHLADNRGNDKAKELREAAAKIREIAETVGEN